MRAQQQPLLMLTVRKKIIISVLNKWRVQNNNIVGVLKGVCDTVNEYSNSYSRGKTVLRASTMIASLKAKYSNQQCDAHEFFTFLVTNLLEKLSPE